jgi:hypothetical protein
MAPKTHDATNPPAVLQDTPQTILTVGPSLS